MMRQMKERMTEQMKKLIMVVAVVFVAVLGFPVNAKADNINVQQNTNPQWYGGNSYIVNSTVTINERIVVNGNVTLELNGGTLTAAKGISVQDGSSLTINSKRTGEDKYSGTLIAYGADHCAAIGGASEIKSGTITINGGNILAYGGSEAAGIGGGYKADSAGEIKITDGNVTAWSGLCAAAIGGGYKGENGQITITGGDIKAYGWAFGAGIGSGYDKNSGPIDIIGSKPDDKTECQVYAYVREYPNYGSGAAIGSGNAGNCSKPITIKNAIVTVAGFGAYTDYHGGAGIGAGGAGLFGGSGDMKTTITIENSQVAATGGPDGAAGIGAGRGGNMTGTVKIIDSEVKAGGGRGAAGIGGGCSVYGHMGGEGGTVYIQGKSDVIAIGGRSSDNYIRCSAIGHGYKDNVTGHIYIDKGLMVDAGNDPNGLEERRYTAVEREGACMYRFAAHIYPCQIHLLDATYSTITKDTHTQDTCEYCGQTFTAEQHHMDENTNMCKDCGYQGELCTVTFSYGSEKVQQAVVPGNPIQLPLPDDLNFKAQNGYAFTGYWEIGSYTYPAGGTFKINGNLNAVAQVAKAYPLWVDGVQVNAANCVNVLGDGSNPTVVYDNENKTLTLSGAKITGRHQFKIGNSECYAGIYSELDNLTIDVRGDNIVSPNSGSDTDRVYGIYAENASGSNIKIIDKGYGSSSNEVSSLRASGNYAGIYLDGKLETDKLEISAVADEKISGSYGINAGSIEVKSGILEARGAKAIYYKNSLSMARELGITEPMVGKQEDSTIKDSKGVANKVVISEDGYPIWVGGQQVTRGNNRGSLWGAIFDPANKTLSFSNSTVTFDGSADAQDAIDAFIYSNLDELTIVGPNGDTGDLTINASNMPIGIYSNGKLTIKSGTATITAKETAIDAGSITTTGNLDVTTKSVGDSDYLISTGGDITVKGNLKGQSLGTGVSAYGNVKVTGDLTLKANKGTLLNSWENIEIGGAVSTEGNTEGNTSKYGLTAFGTITKTDSSKAWVIKNVASAMEANNIVIPLSNGIRLGSEAGELCMISHDSPKSVLDSNGNTAGNIVISEAVALPKAVANLIYNGEEQELVIPGAPASGKMLYAKSTSADANTNGLSFSESIPTAKDAGTYYVWYKIEQNGAQLAIGPLKLNPGITISKADYDGLKEMSITLVGTSSSTSVILPNPPAGAAYSTTATKVEDSNNIISSTSISNNTLNVTTNNVGTGAIIKVPVREGNNYKNYDMIVNVTVNNKGNAGVEIKAGGSFVAYGEIEAIYGSDITLEAKATSKGQSGKWSWTSSNENVAKVNKADASTDYKGKVSIIGVGTTIITAVYESDTTYGMAVIMLTVNKKPVDSNSIVWSGETSFIYDGNSHVPLVTIGGLTQGTDYTVTGAATNVGTYTAEVSLTEAGAKKYQLPADNTKCSFAIEKKSISDAVVTLGTKLTYTGGEQTQNITSIKLGAEDIKNYCDIYGNMGTFAGDYALLATAKNNSNYTGSVMQEYQIARKSITPDVRIVGGPFYYIGSAVTPEYTVKDGNIDLSWMDYIADFSNNINVGTAYLTVSADEDGNYSFSPVKKSFTILKPGDTPEPSGGGGAGGGGTTPGEPYTIPVENEEIVPVGATITDGTAVVDEITPSIIEEISTTTGERTTDTLTINLSLANQDVNAVELTKSTIDTLAETTASSDININTVTVVLSNAIVELDAKALKTISEESRVGEKVIIAIEEKKTSDLSEIQQTALSGKTVEKVISASVTSGTTEISSFGGGSLRVTVDDRAPDDRDFNYFHVYYLDNLGKLFRYITEHTGFQAIFRTYHLSDYVIIYDESDQNEIIPPITSAVIEPVTYNGSKQTVKIASVGADAVDMNEASVPADAYTVSGTENVKSAGTYTLTITAKEGSGYRGSVKVTYEVKKADQEMTVKAKNVRVKQGTKKVKPKKAFKVSGSVGKVTYEKLEGDEQLSIRPNGKIKIKKGTKKGTYTMTVQVSSAGDKNHNPGSQTVEVVIKIK